MMKDGKRIDVSLSVPPIKNDIGKISGVSVITHGITEHKRAETQMQRQQQRLAIQYEINAAITSTLDLPLILNRLLEKIESLLHYSAAVVWLVNKDSGESEPVAARNIDVEELRARFRKSPHTLVGQVFETKSPVIVTNSQTGHRVLDRDYFRKRGWTSFFGWPLLIKDEILGILSLYAKDQQSMDSEEVEFLTILAGQAAIAIHNSRLYEQTKKQAEELERARKLQANFMAMVVHDLRSFLNTIIGPVSLLEEGMMGPLTGEQSKWLTKIDSSARKLLDLVNDFLDLSKLEAGRISVVKERVDLNQLIMNSIDSHRLLAQDKKISLESLATPVSRIQADPRRLEQVFTNLLSNAIKFTGEGGKIQVGATQNGTEVKVWVRDTGIGIPAGEIGQLFEKYRQAASGIMSQYKGTGLGLVICKMIAEAHGGKIWVESQEGKGTTFFFTLPHQVLENK